MSEGRDSSIGPPVLSLQHQLMQNSKLVAAFGGIGEDEASIDFSIDPDMYKKLEIRKARKGEENALDLEKIYNFQLKKDLEKLVKVKGSYEERNSLYLSARETDPYYQSIASVTEVGAKGKFSEINPYVAEEAWRSTSQPYGVIAHKRYLEYIKNLPKGPTLEEIKDRAQRTQDKELWEKVVTGKFELTRQDYLRMEEQIARMEMTNAARDQLNYLEEKRKQRIDAFNNNRFDEMRFKCTKREFEKSMKDWKRGIHENYDFEKGLPFIVHDIKTVRSMKQFAVEDEHGPRGPPQFTSERFISGCYGNEKQYANFLAGGNLDKAEEFLKQQRRKVEKEKKIKELEDREKARTRRRVGQAGFAIADQVMRAKMANTEEALRFTIQVEKAKTKGKKKVEVDFLLQGSYESDGAQLFEDSAESKMILPEIKAMEVLQEVKLDGDSVSDSESSSSSSSASKSDPAAGGEEDNAGDHDAEGPATPIEHEKNVDGLTGIHESFITSENPSPMENLQSMWSSVTKRMSGFKPSAVVPIGYFEANKGDKKKKKTKEKPAIKKKEENIKKGPSLWERYEDGEFSKEAMGEWIAETLPGKATLKVYRKFKKLHHFIYDETPYKTPTQVKKEHEINRLRDLAEEINQVPFRERVMELKDHDIKLDEFMLEAKKKNRYFKKHINALSRLTNANKDDIHKLEVLQIRYRHFLAGVKERKEREHRALQVIDIMQQLIKQEQEEQQELIITEEMAIEKVWKYVVNNFIKRKRPSEKVRRKLDRFLPPTSDEFDEEDVMKALRYRLVERAIIRRSKHFFRWLLGKPPSEDPERFLHKPSVDELIFAAQCGDYRRCLDLLDMRDTMFHAQDPLVDVNGVGVDQTTATFAILFNVIKQEMLDDNANLDDLFLTPTEKFFKKCRTVIGKILRTKPKSLDFVRFDLVIQILLYYGGDLMFPKVEFGQDGMTVFHHAAQANAKEVVEFLLERGVDINHLTTIHHRTALMIAVERDYVDLVMFLLRKGAIIAIHHIDNLGCNVLHYAARYGSPLLTEMLLICGARTNVRNLKGYIPAEEAKLLNRLELAATIQGFKSGQKDHVMRIQSVFEKFPDSTGSAFNYFKNAGFQDSGLGDLLGEFNESISTLDGPAGGGSVTGPTGISAAGGLDSPGHPHHPHNPQQSFKLEASPAPPSAGVGGARTPAPRRPPGMAGRDGNSEEKKEDDARLGQQHGRSIGVVHEGEEGEEEGGGDTFPAPLDANGATASERNLQQLWNNNEGHDQEDAVGRNGHKVYRPMQNVVHSKTVKKDGDGTDAPAAPSLRAKKPMRETVLRAPTVRKTMFQLGFAQGGMKK